MATDRAELRGALQITETLQNLQQQWRGEKERKQKVVARKEAISTNMAGDRQWLARENRRRRRREGKPYPPGA